MCVGGSDVRSAGPKVVIGSRYARRLDWWGLSGLHGPREGGKWLVDDDEGRTMPRGVCEG